MFIRLTALIAVPIIIAAPLQADEPKDQHEGKQVPASEENVRLKDGNAEKKSRFVPIPWDMGTKPTAQPNIERQLRRK